MALVKTMKKVGKSAVDAGKMAVKRIPANKTGADKWAAGITRDTAPKLGPEAMRKKWGVSKKGPNANFADHTSVERNIQQTVAERRYGGLMDEAMEIQDARAGRLDKAFSEPGAKYSSITESGEAMVNASRIDRLGNLEPVGRFDRTGIDRMIQEKIGDVKGVNKYEFQQVQRELDSMTKASSAGNYDAMGRAGSNFGIDPKDARNMPAVQQQVVSGAVERIQNPGFMSHMGYHKVPQRGAAFVGTAYLVNNMAGRKGQQSNAELYGQSRPYS